MGLRNSKNRFIPVLEHWKFSLFFNTVYHKNIVSKEKVCIAFVANNKWLHELVVSAQSVANSLQIFFIQIFFFLRRGPVQDMY